MFKILAMSCTEESMNSLLNELQNSPDCRFQFDYLSEKKPNPFEWKCLLEGLQGSIYEGGFYMVKIIFPTNYPNSRPEVYFLNKILHPHVSSTGRCCIVPLQNDIISVMKTVENMLKKDFLKEES